MLSPFKKRMQKIRYYSKGKLRNGLSESKERDVIIDAEGN